MAISWYKNIRKVLKDEPELWLSYIHGQQLENITHLAKIKPRYRGLPLQLMKFSYLLMKAWHPFPYKNIDNSAEYFVFAGTSNQMDALDTTIDALRSAGATVVAVAPKHLLNQPKRKERYVAWSLSSTDIMKTMVLLAWRGPFLYQELKKLHPEAVSWWFSNFCFIYAYLAYFQRVLPLMPLECVITANDHNAPNRCMLAIAHELSIKTAYLQHASVSPLFPALRVNYAFLDGKYSSDVYRQCEQNQPHTERSVPIPEVFLTGQKKPIAKNDKGVVDSIGIALNSLDDIDVAISFINRLVDLQYNIVIRWHPGQSESDIKEIKKAFEEYKVVNFSDPKDEPVSQFLSRINWLIAGNSSIHLEAALANVKCMYYELVVPDVPDYYGYVKNGLAIKVSSVEEIDNSIRSGIDFSDELQETVRYYSATYQTEWEGREGELVAEILKSIEKGTHLSVTQLNY